ncbi:MAG: serine hydrolase [Pseudomonadota bacterium]
MGRLTVLWLILLLVVRPALAADPFDDLVARAMAHWQVPGLALAAVQDGEVVVEQVYGLRDVEAGLPVTPETLFQLGSVTKSLTASGLALLAGQGAFDWDAPVDGLLPGFALTDADVTARDLMTHRSGVPRHDALWYLEAYDRDQLIRRLGHLTPTRERGAAFQYSNLMVMAAGALAGHLAGTTWEDFTRTRLLEPLAMDNARLSLAGFLAAPNRATGYFPGEPGRIRIPPRDTDQIAPAAALYADLEDMIRYLRFLLARGDPLVLPGEIERLWRGDGGYGLGFYLRDHRGFRVVRHGGVIDGYAAELLLAPEADIGIVVLSNLSGANPVPRLVAKTLLDRLLNLEPIDWIGRRMARDAAAPRPAYKLVALGTPARPLAAYAGRYRHPAYGTMEIAPEPDGPRLQGRLHGIDFLLVPRGGDLWQVAETVWPLRAGLEMRFEGDTLLTPLADVPSDALNPGDLVFRRIR